MKKFILIFVLVSVIILSGCSTKPKGSKYSDPFGLKITSLREMVANPNAYTYDSNNHYAIGPLYVESNDLERKTLTIHPLMESGEKDMDVQIELYYGKLGYGAEFIKTTKGDVVYARGQMANYNQSNNYFFYVEEMRYAIQKK